METNLSQKHADKGKPNNVAHLDGEARGPTGITLGSICRRRERSITGVRKINWRDTQDLEGGAYLEEGVEPVFTVLRPLLICFDWLGIGSDLNRKLTEKTGSRKRRKRRRE